VKRQPLKFLSFSRIHVVRKKLWTWLIGEFMKYRFDLHLGVMMLPSILMTLFVRWGTDFEVCSSRTGAWKRHVDNFTALEKDLG